MNANDTLILEGRFRLVQPLAAGGMGEVYLGNEVATGRKVAVKVLHRDAQRQPEMLERFQREAKLLSAVEHPAVVRIIEFGHTNDTAYLVMEFIEGESLHALLQTGGLAVPTALSLLAQLADGLAAIHDQGIVHRDLKPENVILSQGGTAGEQARLLDFGIARLADPEPIQQVSQVGLVIGTPEYLSPEQALGGKVSAKSDLYSFGVLAYQVLSGALPFRGPGPRQFLLQHIGEPPIALTQAAPALAAHPLLVSIVMRLLEKETAQRFEDAHQMADAFREALATLPQQLATVAWSGAAKVAGSSGTAVHGGATSRQQGGTMTYGAEIRIPAEGLGTTRTVKADAALSSYPLRKATVVGAVSIALATAALTAGWLFHQQRLEVRARALFEEGQAKQVLTLSAPDSDAPSLGSLHAHALHVLGRHVDEHHAVKNFSKVQAQAADPLLYEGLAADFATAEEGKSVRAALASLPVERLQAELESLASRPASTTQWGALRYLEAIQHTENLKLVQLYSNALLMAECGVRVRAASRLAALGDRAAIPFLLEVTRASPPGASEGSEGCGEEEARDTLRKLGH